jgi:phage terminase large subunit-like protein
MKRRTILNSFVSGMRSACERALEKFNASNVELYKKSMYFLGKYVLGYSRFCATQWEWDKWFRGIFAFNPQRRAFALKLAPRETFKSTFFVVTAAIAILLSNPNLTILIAGETQGNADAHLKEIKSKYESERFQEVFGDWVSPNLWREDAINVSKRTIITKEANIETAGIGKSLTGKHYDVVICDDIVGMEDRDSDAKRKDTFGFFNGLFDVLKKESGCLLGTGTRWHQEDLYAHIIDRLAPDMEHQGVGKFHVSVIPAHDPDTKAINYPELLPETRLQELRTVKQGEDGVDISTFMAQYELAPLDPSTQIFKQFHFINPVGLTYSRFAQWTDPSLGESKDSDYSAIITVGKISEGEHKGKVLCLIADINRRSPTNIIKDHNRVYREVHAQFPDIDNCVAIEQNGFAGLKDFANADSLKDENEIPVPTRAVANTENKDIRIKSLEPAISTGMLLFREDWHTAPGNYRLLIEQLKGYPQSKKDGPDALQCAYRQVNKAGTQIL